MSSHDQEAPGPGRRRFIAGLGVLGLLALGGCFRPLYGTQTLASGENLLEVLRAVDVQTAGGRTNQLFRNELLFLLRGGKEGVTPQYRLEYSTTERTSAISVQQLSDVPQSLILNLNLVFTLWDISQDRVVLEGTSFAEASYSFSNQRFANARARLDAQERAAKVIADDVHTRIVAFLSQRAA